MTPAWAKRASIPTAGDAAAAVCEAPARWPPDDRPPTTARSGLRSAKRRASLRELRLRCRTTPGRGPRRSPAGRRSRRPAGRCPETSALLPSEMNAWTPSPSSRATSSRAIPTPPDWEATARPPGGGTVRENVALRRMAGSLDITPRQFGPTRRMLFSRATRSISRCISAPSGPSSPSPDEMTTTAETPASAASSTAARTRAAGTAMIARSTCAGTSASRGKAGIPSIEDDLGMDDEHGPWNSPAMIDVEDGVSEPGGVAPDADDGDGPRGTAAAPATSPPTRSRAGRRRRWRAPRPRCSSPRRRRRTASCGRPRTRRPGRPGSWRRSRAAPRRRIGVRLCRDPLPRDARAAGCPGPGRARRRRRGTPPRPRRAPSARRWRRRRSVARRGDQRRHRVPVPWTRWST